MASDDDNSKSSESESPQDSSLKRKRNPLVDKQRSHIDYLMKHIDKPVDLSVPEKPAIKPPPDIVLNVRGSSAGAGSSDFSIYRDQRRKENLRIKLMEAEAARDKAKEQFENEMESLKQKDNEKTAKNRAKRQKRKNRAKRAKK
ncbi:hypothetical protein IWW36_001377 [Coemansia brasiliensis]|uniref:DUF1168-domain-containing protein n=1 Tax=Coemansia brasiliensis TaxID=2650707 RepID=A0A9W8I997_9FUNG|nr:hypothetical protein IWW36_001377 [Coemansia brasiliensis]